MPSTRRLVPLCLPIPLFLLSVSLPKLQEIYTRPELTLPLETLLVTLLLLGIGWSLARAGRRGLLPIAGIAISTLCLAGWILHGNPNRLSALREIVHIGEYMGLLITVTLCRPISWSTPVLISYGCLVGGLDELVQLYHPLRVGDLRDVLTDCLSGALGVAYVHLVLRRKTSARSPLARPASFLMFGAALSVVILLFGLTRSGYLIEDPECGRFHSRMSRASLLARCSGTEPDDYRRILARDAARPLFAIEDFYLSEAKGHQMVASVSSRGIARCERCILARYFGPAALALGARSAREEPPKAGCLSPYLAFLTSHPSRRVWLMISSIPLILGIVLRLR